MPGAEGWARAESCSRIEAGKVAGLFQGVEQAAEKLAGGKVISQGTFLRAAENPVVSKF